jgi:hypothetical protein
VLTWGELAERRPELAEAGRALFYQFGVGLALLGTVRADGGPRMHPMCPIIVDDHLYALIEPGPKRSDLHRDGRYAMHCYPPAENEDAFYITGRAEHRSDPVIREQVANVFWAERGAEEIPPQSRQQQLFEFFVETCLLTRTTGHGDWNPQHTIWNSGVED